MEKRPALSGQHSEIFAERIKRYFQDKKARKSPSIR
jgi:hypothetical protein